MLYYVILCYITNIYIYIIWYVYFHTLSSPKTWILPISNPVPGDWWYHRYHGSWLSVFKHLQTGNPKQPKQYWRFPYKVVPPNGWFTMENPMKMDDYFHMTTSITGKSMPKDELRAHCWQRPLHWTRPSRCGPLFLAQSPANMERKWSFLGRQFPDRPETGRTYEHQI